MRVTFAYDRAGRRVLVSDSTGRTTTVYDLAGEVTAVQQPQNKLVSYSYDLAGRRAVLRDPDGGRSSYTHDGAGQLTSLTSPQDGITGFSYDLPGREKLKNLSAISTEVFHTYDAAGQEVGLKTSNPGSGLIRRLTYSYDGASRRLQQLASDGTRATWSYDPTGQLVHEQRNGPVVFNYTYTYDPAGNRLVLNSSGTRTTYTYDAANEMLYAVTGTAVTTYQYDAAGNRTLQNAPSAATYYTWDANNRMVQAEPVAGVVSYAYDGIGRRVQKQLSGATTQYIYDFEKVLQEADGSGTTEYQYLTTDKQYGDLVSAYGSSGSLRYYGYDALGSTELLLNDSGTVADTYEYTAFGQVNQITGTDPSFYAWVGILNYRAETETSLYLLGGGNSSGLGGRYFNPIDAVFLSPDPVGFQAGDANLYLYSFNDPVNRVDPSGNWDSDAADKLLKSGNYQTKSPPTFIRGTEYAPDGILDLSAVYTRYDYLSKALTNWMQAPPSVRDKFVPAIDEELPQLRKLLDWDRDHNPPNPRGIEKPELRRLTPPGYASGTWPPKSTSTPQDYLNYLVDQAAGLKMKSEKIERERQKGGEDLAKQGLSITPVGPLMFGYEALWGKDIFQNQLSNEQRVVSGVFASLPLAARFVQKVAPLLTATSKGKKLASALADSVKALEEATTPEAKEIAAKKGEDLAKAAIEELKAPKNDPLTIRPTLEMADRQAMVGNPIHDAYTNPLNAVRAPKNIPHGFANEAEFNAFGKQLNEGLAKAGYGETQPIFQGSSVTGKKFTTGEAFDVGRVSDFDIALADPKLLAKAKEKGIGLRASGTRTGPLTVAELEKLGLKDLAEQLSKQAGGREVNFMIFQSAETATARSPSIVVPGRP